jgi:oligoendopeptidase F
MTEIAQFFITTLVGSGVGTAIVGAFFKRRFDAQLETHKALLQRSSRIHERQVDALLMIHAKLELALHYLQRAASTSKFQNEPPEQELLQSMARELGAASEEYSKTKLLISSALTARLDEFFGKVFLAGMSLNSALSPMTLDGEPRAKLWKQTQDAAYKETPLILEAIRTEARAVIHG